MVWWVTGCLQLLFGWLVDWLVVCNGWLVGWLVDQLDYIIAPHKKRGTFHSMRL